MEWGECTVLWNLTALHATIPSSAAPAAPPSTPPSSSTRSLGPGSDSALFPIQVGTRNQEGKGSVVSTRRRKEKKGEERRRKKKKEEERRRKKKKGEERRKRLRLVLCLKSCQGSIGGGAHLSERRHHAGCTLLIRPATPVRNLADEHTVDLRLGGGLAHSRAAGLGDVQQVCMHHAKQRARKKRSKGRKQTDAKKRSRENGSE